MAALNSYGSMSAASRKRGFDVSQATAPRVFWLAK